VNRQRLVAPVARHRDAAPVAFEAAVADPVRVRQQRIARERVRIGRAIRLLATAEHRHRHAVIAAPVEARDAAAEMRQHVEPQQRVRQRDGRRMRGADALRERGGLRAGADRLRGGSQARAARLARGRRCARGRGSHVELLSFVDETIRRARAAPCERDIAIRPSRRRPPRPAR
jgi:hypothetical protein